MDGDDTEGDVRLRMTSEEFHAAVRDAVEDAILNIFVFLLGLVLTFAFVISGFQMIVSTPGIFWNLFGILNVLVGASVFWWAVLR